MNPFPLPSVAQSLILELICPIVVGETVPLEQALGRILAQAVTAQQDFPYWDNGAMDGYAVRYEDVATASVNHPVKLNLRGEVAAGKVPDHPVLPGEAMRIFTGAMVPTGADTVVMQEVCRREGDSVWVEQSPKQRGEFVRCRGDYYQADAPWLSAGMVVREAELAILATAQVTQVLVWRRPRVVLFSSGNELISPDRPLQPGQIVDSNQYAIRAFLQSQGAEVISLGIVGDRREDLRAVTRQAVDQGDLVISTGGVSVGDYDFIPALLTELGGTLAIEKVASKPGKPLKVAKFANGCVYFGIPGNPVSALVSCWRFVQPALQKLSGLAAPHAPTWITAQTQDFLKSDGKRETYLWGRLDFTLGTPQFHLAKGSHSSANLINLGGTNSLAMIPQGQTAIAAQALVKVLVQPRSPFL
jgi:molybdopterin molybdotransferase